MQKNPGNQQHLINSSACHIEFKSSMGFKEFEDCSGKWTFTDTRGGVENKLIKVIVSCGKNVTVSYGKGICSKHYGKSTSNSKSFYN